MVGGVLKVRVDNVRGLRCAAPPVAWHNQSQPDGRRRCAVNRIPTQSPARAGGGKQMQFAYRFIVKTIKLSLVMRIYWDKRQIVRADNLL